MRILIPIWFLWPNGVYVTPHHNLNISIFYLPVDANTIYFNILEKICIFFTIVLSKMVIFRR